MKKTIVLVAGRNSAGKSAITKKLAEKYGLKLVQSYTTRKPRQKELEKGLENSDHLFISESEFDRIEKNPENIAAKTEINGFRYCTTKDVLAESDFYVIDPIGIESLKEACGNKFHFVEFYVYADYDIRKKRYMGRGETEDDFKQRESAESSQFSEYERNHGYDIIIYNNRNIDDAVAMMDSYVSLILEKRIEEIKNQPVIETFSAEAEEGVIEVPLSNIDEADEGIPDEMMEGIIKKFNGQKRDSIEEPVEVEKGCFEIPESYAEDDEGIPDEMMEEVIKEKSVSKQETDEFDVDDFNDMFDIDDDNADDAGITDETTHVNMFDLDDDDENAYEKLFGSSLKESEAEKAAMFEGEKADEKEAEREPEEPKDAEDVIKADNEDDDDEIIFVD